MRAMLLAVALLATGGCASVRDLGGAFCATQEKSAEIFTRAGTAIGIGPVGPLFADLLNMATELGCAILDQALSAPADVGDLVGLTTPEAPAPEGNDGGPEGG